MSDETSLAPGPTCPQHPEVAAPFVCARCQTAVCVDCCYSMPDGSVCCKTCYQTEPSPAPAPQNIPPAATPSLRLAMREPVAHEPSHASAVRSPGGFAARVAGLACVQHPHLPAMARCRVCGAGSCQTCDFVFPPNLHYCPKCAASATGKVSPRRKKYMIWSYVLAGSALIGFVVSMGAGAVGMAEDAVSQTVLGLLLIVLAGVPSVIGTALGMSAWRSGGPNPVAVWIALIWNVLQSTGFILLVVIGNMMD